MASPGDRENLPLEEEPLAFLHPVEAGTVPPVHDVGGRPGLALEEEPAEWIEFRGVPRAPLPAPGPGAQPSPADGAADGGTDGGAPMPATGGGIPAAVGLGGLVAAWLLRRRSAG